MRGVYVVPRPHRSVKENFFAAVGRGRPREIPKRAVFPHKQHILGPSTLYQNGFRINPRVHIEKQEMEMKWKWKTEIQTKNAPIMGAVSSQTHE